jgi:hypothetical protein
VVFVFPVNLIKRCFISLYSTDPILQWTRTRFHATYQTNFHMIFTRIFLFKGRAIGHAVSCRRLIAKARVRFQASLCEICGEQSGSGTGRGFSLSNSTVRSQYHSTCAPYSSLSACCSYQQEKRAKPRNLQRNSSLWAAGERVYEKLLWPCPVQFQKQMMF